MPQSKNGNFFMVANRIFDFKLKPRDFIVYCCLLRHSDKNGVCFPSRKLIANECQIDIKTVDAAIKTLEKAGLLKKEQRRRKDGTNTSNRYILNLLRQGDFCIGDSVKNGIA